MIIDCVADLHGHFPELPGGDLLILAGDYTANDLKEWVWVKFFQWLEKQPYRKKVLIAGNHDGFFVSGFPTNQKESNQLKEIQEWLMDMGEIEPIEFEYLCDSGIEFEGLKIWGTPWTPWFDRVNPMCASFMENEEFLDGKFSLIPEDTDILVTHGPMLHILDQNIDGYACGSRSLRKHVERVKPRFHIFGHIHEQGGNKILVKHSGPNTYCVN